MIDWDAFQSYGWSFFPVHARSADPAVKWKRLETERPSPDEVANWKRRGYQNVGIVTGAISGFFALDVDSDEAQAKIDTLGMPPTMTVKTRRGRHYYLKHPGFKVKNAVAILDGKIDIRGDGGFVIGPGSHHKKDHNFEYTWEDPSPIAEAPQWLLDEIKPKPLPVPPPRTNGAAHRTGDAHPYAQAVLDNALKRIREAKEGVRNNTLNDNSMAVGHYIVSGNLSITSVQADLLAAALSNGTPERAALATIGSGLRAGMAEPRAIPEREHTKRKQAAAVRDVEDNPNWFDGGITAADLQKQVFEPTRYIVPPILPEGSTLLGARPKRGKSYLMLGVSIEVADSGYALGSLKCEGGDVLGLFLEDSRRRLNSRMTQMMGDRSWPERLTLFTMEQGWPRLNEGGLERIEQWIKRVERPRLVVIDVLQSVRALPDKNRSPYENDYEALKALTQLANIHRLAIVAIHHCRKAASDGDPFDELSGTTGLTGAANTTLVLKRGEGRSDFLYGRGHDLPEFEKAVSFDKITGLWRILGDADAYRGNELEKKIVAALEASGDSMTPREVSDAIDGESYHNVRKRVQRMAVAGQIRKAERGKYRAVA